MSPDSVMSGVNGSLHGYNLYAYCFNNPIMYTDYTGNWPEWVEKAKEWATNQWNNLTHVVSKTANILFTKDFVNQIDDILLSNIEADAGICLGMGIETDVGSVHIEAITRMDIIGVQNKNKKIRIGHDGRSAFNIGFGMVSIGPQSDTFETFDGRADDPEHKFFDIGLSYGKAQAFVIGYHYNASISFLGIFIDIVNYVEENW